MRILLIIVFISIFCQLPALATLGLAEWEIKTPGGNMISHIDPYINLYGTCIRPPNKGVHFAKRDKATGLIDDDTETVYVANIIRWKYANGSIGGECAKGFFLFNEKTHLTLYFHTEDELNKRLSAYNPSWQWLTPQDGANQCFWEDLFSFRQKKESK